MTSRHINFPCGDIRLEGELHLPDGKGAFPAVVVCHPHPLYGGNMDNNLVTTICSYLVRSSIATLRFNFRGVGNSGGSYGEGIGEQDDALAAVDLLYTLKEIDSKRIGLAGYSFGGMVAMSVASKDNRIQQLALLSPAIKETGWMLFKEYNKPKLVLVGNADNRVPFQPFKRYFGDTGQYQIIAGADHFWSGYETEISGKIARFFHDGFYKEGHYR